MAKKTATLHKYVIYGTKSGLCVDILYRGRLLKYFDGETNEELAIVEKAKLWAFYQGFTDTKIVYKREAFKV